MARNPQNPSNFRCVTVRALVATAYRRCAAA